MDDKCCFYPPWHLSLSGFESPLLSQCRRSSSNHGLQSTGWLLEVQSSNKSLNRPQREPSSAPDEKHDNKHNSPSLFCPVRVTLWLPAWAANDMSLSMLPQSLLSRLFVFCSQTDRAVQLLLETSADNPSYYCDSLKACLVTTITSSGPSQSTIKLVATNMIANGKLAGRVTVWLIAMSYLLCSYFNEWSSVHCVGVCSLERPSKYPHIIRVP